MICSRCSIKDIHHDRFTSRRRPLSLRRHSILDADRGRASCAVPLPGLPPPRGGAARRLGAGRPRRARCQRDAENLCFVTAWAARSEEHTSELQSLMRISYAVFCLKKKTKDINQNYTE